MKKEDTIRKLLRLAKNHAATPAEAAAAMAKARQLAEESNIDLDKVDTSETSTQLSNLSHSMHKAPATYLEHYAAGLAARQFSCERYFYKTRGGTYHYFVGPQAFVALAGYAFDYLRKSMAAAWKHRKNKRLRDKKSFIRGFAAVMTTMMPPEFIHRALAESADCDAYLKDKILGGGGTITKKSYLPSKVNTAAYYGGTSAARSAGIRNALNP